MRAIHRPFVLLLPCILALGPSIPFTPYHSEEGVTVEIAKTSDPLRPWIRAVTTIPEPLEKVAAILEDFGRYETVFSSILKSAKILQITKQMACLHVVWPYPFPFSNRDAVVTYRIERKQGVFLLRWVGDKEAEPKEGVRVEQVEGEVKLEPIGKQTRATYTYIGDLGGDFSESNNEKAWKKESGHYFKAILSELKRTHQPAN